MMLVFVLILKDITVVQDREEYFAKKKEREASLLFVEIDIYLKEYFFMKDFTILKLTDTFTNCVRLLKIEFLVTERWKLLTTGQRVTINF